MGIVKTEAVLIREMDYSESSKIVTFYSLKNGKVRAIAKGARKIKSKFANSINLFNHLNIIYYEKDGNTLFTVSEADTIEAFSKIQLPKPCLPHIKIVPAMKGVSGRSNLSRCQREVTIALTGLVQKKPILFHDAAHA